MSVTIDIAASETTPLLRSQPSEKSLRALLLEKQPLWFRAWIVNQILIKLRQLNSSNKFEKLTLDNIFAHSYSGDICIKAATVPGNVLKNVKELPRIIIELGANNEPSDTVVSCIGIPFLNVISRCAVAVASKSMNATTFQLLDASETTVLNSEYMYFMKKKYLTKKDCNPHALYMCGVLSRKKAESFDISEAKEFLEKAISNGHRSRCTSEKKNDLPIDCNDELIESASLGERSAQATLKKTIKAETLLEWEQTSSTTALLNTGFCYATGIGCIASIEKAEYFLTKAATLGNVIAAHNLVELFKRDLIKNIPEAAHAVLEKHQHSFRRAMLLNLAKLNNSTEVIDLLKKTPINSSNMNYLNYMLGTCAYEGIGCNKNTQEAQQYFLKAANNGHARSQFNLGVLSSKPEEQTEWFTKAMENGCVDAKIALAQLLVTQGEAGKAREAFHLYFDAAKSGHPVAQTAVGAFFAGVYETSVPNKEKLAQIWFRLSAEQGYSLAIGALAICSLKNQKIRQGNELLALLRTQAKHELKSFIDNKETGLKGYLKRELLIQEKDHIFKIVPCMDNLQFNAVVVKQILNNSDTAKEVLIQRKKKEYMLMCTPHWKHVMRAIQYESNTGAIIMEKAQGSLYDFVVSQALSFEMKTKLLLNACEGVLDMHKDGWVHSDLNTFNMLVVDDSVKISDLDTAVNLTNRWLSPPAQIGYTLNFAAPEQLKGIVGFKGDVYNIGITMHHLYTGKGPYENCSPSDISLKIMNGELPEWETSDKYESRMKEIAVLCCSMNPHDRPDVGELICKIKRSEKEISVACKLILFLNLFVVFLLATAIAISAIRPSNCGTDVCSMRSAPNVLALSQDIAAMNNGHLSIDARHFANNTGTLFVLLSPHKDEGQHNILVSVNRNAFCEAIQSLKMLLANMREMNRNVLFVFISDTVEAKLSATSHPWYYKSQRVINTDAYAAGNEDLVAPNSLISEYKRAIPCSSNLVEHFSSSQFAFYSTFLQFSGMYA